MRSISARVKKINEQIKCFTVIIFMACASMASAQTDQFQFSHLNINNGLSHNQVNYILKDKQGFMWFGTLSGLNRYDGYNFRVFKHNTQDTSSLNDDFILTIAEGPGNKLWVETRNGFNIYDPKTERFSHNIAGYFHSIGIPDSGIPGQTINAIRTDHRGNFWFLHPQLGVYAYAPATSEVKHLIHKADDTATISATPVSDVAQDAKGNMWLMHSDGLLERLDQRDYHVNFRLTLGKPVPVAVNNGYHIYIDKQDDIWAYVPNNASGVCYFNPDTHKQLHIDKGLGPFKLNNNVISGLTQDDQDRIWITTDHGGINLLSKKDFSIKYILDRDDDEKSLGQNSLVTIYHDDNGIVWTGTYKKGVSYYHESIIKFPLYTHLLSDPKSLPYSDINNFAEDPKGNLWIATNGGGLVYFDRQKGTFKSYMHNPANRNSLTNNVIVCLYIDHAQKLWIGTYFGGLDCFDGKNFTHYRHSDADTNSISDDRICAIREDEHHNLLVGTLSEGLNVLNMQTGKFHRYPINTGDNSLHSNYVSAVLEDRRKNIWVVTSYGVDILQKSTGKFIHYVHNEKDPHSIINNNTNNIYEDNRGLIWVSTREGLSIFSYKTGNFTNIIKQDGLPDNTVIDIQEDNAHNMWVSTPNGLSKIIVDYTGEKLKFRFINYNETDGLQGREFTENASFKTRSGELMFGGGNGFNIFDPAKLPLTRNVPQLVFTDFQIFNQSLKAGEKLNGQGKPILTEAITGLHNVELKYNQNVFSIEFAALNYFNPDKVKFQYMMDGFDNDWINADIKTRKATYTNLDPGYYTFKVRQSTNEVWGQPLALRVHVTPPFWKTTIAYIIYLFASVGALMYFRRRGIQKIRSQFAIEKEREEAQRMHELDLMKIKFFTNVSHEFRTPLSLIMAPVDKVLKQVRDTEIQRQLLVVNRNARRLLNLVNQLLDFRKMEHQELKLYERGGDIVKFIKELSYSFTDIGDQKHITFTFDSEAEHYYTSFDHDKIERIMFNLLSNAYKFTPVGGQVCVLVNVKDTDIDNLSMVEIRIMDSGIGIASEKIPHIFEPFFQADIPGNMLNQGSGIGLAITKEFVRLHRGEIYVESMMGEGSTFTVILPLKKLDDSILQDAPIVLDHNENTGEENTAAITLRSSRDVKKPTILLVEDNDDFRYYLKDNLAEWFHIIEADNGKKGWQKALAQHPNLIVSDITMPEMTGIELCVKIRGDKRTSHIPVILLTAMAGEEQQLRGLETGATDYMTKPFNFEILNSKIKNILNQQEHMRKTYQKQVEVKPTDVQTESPDEAFINKVLSLIDSNISNPNFSVEELSGEMFVSRYTLYKKILMMTGKTPNELVRQMRLKRAAQLLENGHLTISQVCHKVGFKSQKYFVRSFKAEFNTIPSKYVESLPKDTVQSLK